MRDGAVVETPDGCCGIHSTVPETTGPSSPLAHALHEDFHDAAANLVFALDVFCEVDDYELGLAAGDDVHGRLPDLGLAAAAADGAAEGGVFAHSHLGAGL